ncbi:GNAT family N-acetyltransferase [Streptomyces sp. NPDC051704]|uniref:GNAT family N-acetyltransferase n=1 Tax=Streptomyces sp. NPDC051704 TaxID=3365671 RepID=UPI0037910F93
MDVIFAEDESAVRRCWPVFSQLRPHLDEDGFAERWRTQSAEGYRIVCLEEDGEVRVAAGFRVMHTMISGRILYLDDLVTDEAVRGRGLGSHMLTALKAIAADEGCMSSTSTRATSAMPRTGPTCATASGSMPTTSP